MDYSCPTLVLAECALVYLPTSRTSPLLAWLAGAFQAAAFVNYEQVSLHLHLLLHLHLHLHLHLQADRAHGTAGGDAGEAGGGRVGQAGQGYDQPRGCNPKNPGEVFGTITVIARLGTTSI